MVIGWLRSYFRIRSADSEQQPSMPHKQESRSEEEIRASEQEEQERGARIRIKNRRKEYLDRHPSYFESRDLELLGEVT